MDDVRIGRGIRVLRQRRGWRQVDLSARSGVSQSAISDMERGRIDRYTVASARRVLRALDAGATLEVRWGAGGDFDRLLDAAHAGLVQAWAELHHRAGWEVWTEVSFSIFGERGRIDLLAFHRPTGTLEVTEVKTGIWDVQDAIGRLDVKVRLGPRIAADRGWHPRRVLGALVVLEGRTARRRVAQHRLLFARYDTRGRSALAFVRDPRGQAEGLLAFTSLPRTVQDRLRRPGQQRVRPAASAERHRRPQGPGWRPLTCLSQRWLVPGTVQCAGPSEAALVGTWRGPLPEVRPGPRTGSAPAASRPARSGACHTRRRRPIGRA